MAWYSISNQQIHMSILAKPNAKNTAITGVTELGLIISIKEKPDEGKANTALIRFLSKQLGLPQRDITLKQGQKSRIKRVVIPYSEQNLAALLKLG